MVYRGEVWRHVQEGILTGIKREGILVVGRGKEGEGHVEGRKSQHVEGRKTDVKCKQGGLAAHKRVK